MFALNKWFKYCTQYEIWEVLSKSAETKFLSNAFNYSVTPVLVLLVWTRILQALHWFQRTYMLLWQQFAQYMHFMHHIVQSVVNFKMCHCRECTRCIYMYVGKIFIVNLILQRYLNFLKAKLLPLRRLTCEVSI